ncbi:MAG: type II toxin-antitoxin system VapC family toxin [Dehalococcoidia bacterium]
MSEALYCIDTTVWIKATTGEEPRETGEVAKQVVARALLRGRLVLPAWAWAEVASVLRKKVRARLLQADEAERVWRMFLELPIDFIEMRSLRRRAWEIADAFGLPTLYDAAFLACTELAPAPEDTVREFWTADDSLLRSLGNRRPAYVRRLA